jgi:flavin reductase ActVB
MTVDLTTFREAMARFPSGVTIVTTIDSTRKRWGFTASAFTSLSMEPPQLLVCLNRSASCYPHFCESDRFAVNILSADHEALARRFATKGIDKFTSVDFEQGEFQLPLLSDAVAAFECHKSTLVPSGDHVILIGEPLSIRIRSETPAVLFNHRFWGLHEAAASQANGAGSSRSANPATHAESAVAAKRQ